MKLSRTLVAAAFAILPFTTEVVLAGAQPSSTATTPVPAPMNSHANRALPAGVLAWDAVEKEVDATNGQQSARFAFTFTNRTTGVVTILGVHPSCGCTTAEVPPVPWTIPAGSGGLIKLGVNLVGKTGKLTKQVNISTDKGSTNLILRISIAPATIMPAPIMSEAQRAAAIAAAKVDRQAVFKSDCVSCHANKVEGKYGQQLYATTCAVCHEAKNRASMVPDLYNLPVPTNEEFWRTWISSGKPGSLMPAFSSSQGGVLSDLQIASLAAYLNVICPSHLPREQPNKSVAN